VIDKMGLRTSPMAEVTFEDVRVSADARLGREGRGAEVFQSSRNGSGDASGELARRHAAPTRGIDRACEAAQAIRQAIGKFQSVANRIVAMKLRLETARPLVYRIGWLKDEGRSATRAAMASSTSRRPTWSPASTRSRSTAVTGNDALPYERELRDAIGGTLYSGTSEIQRQIIATKLGFDYRCGSVVHLADE